ncbi:hypothetical protein SAMN05660691_00565 [Rheinheimera pacifica]|uniref:Uncharacterized protein n=1 Tax=Rheinheimera pacifica TaxID=173990 RepID=A0A1H6JY73_9GAMM|nr:hypothetical protein [Rheinheimera pacifica]SEH64061.1 hypothetical protein SAMN05660691_00565 [Rheinheimera pacifica]
MSYPPLSAQTLRYLQQLQQRLNASGSYNKPAIWMRQINTAD